LCFKSTHSLSLSNNQIIYIENKVEREGEKWKRGYVMLICVVKNWKWHRNRLKHNEWKKNLVFLWCKNQRRIVLLERITENRKKGSHNINAFLRLSWFLPLFSQLRHLFSFWNFHSNSGKSSFLLFFPLYSLYITCTQIRDISEIWLGEW
jgi:hypothetical protein